MEGGDRLFVAEALDGVAGAVARSHAERAARLFGAAATLRERLGAAVAPWDRPAHERDLAVTRAALSPEAFAVAQKAGAGLSVAEAVAEALTEPSAALPAVDAPAAPDPFAALGLTPREEEVLRLVAQGLSDREIGAALFVSPRTVNGHVSSILAKLGLETRSAVAAFAVRHGLA
jgi:DNA-binding CsgD family transcriptional regulator